jgi:hypothetical protein
VSITDKIEKYLSEARVTTTPEFEKAFNEWFKAAQKMVNDYMKKEFPGQSKSLSFTQGPKRIKIVATNESGHQSVWAFIDKATGDVLKPASWKAPAKGARGNIFDKDKGLKRVGPYGPEYNK